MLDSLIRGIDERFNQESNSILTAVGKMLKFDLNSDDIDILINHFNLSKAEFDSEIRFLKVRNKNSGDILSNKNCSFWLRQRGIEAIFT